MPTKPLKFYLSAYLPPVLWASLIFFLSSQSSLPGLDASVMDFIFKKIAHLTVYAVLYTLIWRAVRLNSSPKATTKQWLMPFILVLLYAVSDEVHQSFTPGRSATARDVGYDLLGSTIAFLCLYGYL